MVRCCSGNSPVSAADVPWYALPPPIKSLSWARCPILPILVSYGGHCHRTQEMAHTHGTIGTMTRLTGSGRGTPSALCLGEAWRETSPAGRFFAMRAMPPIKTDENGRSCLLLKARCCDTRHHRPQRRYRNEPSRPHVCGRLWSPWSSAVRQTIVRTKNYPFCCIFEPPSLYWFSFLFPT
jgi:hypothetical protein